MAEKPDGKTPKLEDPARAEAREATRREDNAKLYLETQARLRAETPPRFFTLARQLREGVARYNGAAKLERPIGYVETAAVTMRDPNPEGDFHVEVARAPNAFGIALRSMHRNRMPDAFVIEGNGLVGPPSGQDAFRVRVDGLYKDGVLSWRITCDTRVVDTPVDELADRLIAVVATGELTRLWTMAPFVAKLS